MLDTICTAFQFGTARRLPFAANPSPPNHLRCLGGTEVQSITLVIGNLPPKSYIVLVKDAKAVATRHCQNGCILASSGGKCHDSDCETNIGHYAGRPPCRRCCSGGSSDSTAKSESCSHPDAAACRAATHSDIATRPDSVACSAATRPTSARGPATRENPGASGSAGPPTRRRSSQELQGRRQRHRQSQRRQGPQFLFARAGNCARQVSCPGS